MNMEFVLSSWGEVGLLVEAQFFFLKDLLSNLKRFLFAFICIIRTSTWLKDCPEKSIPEVERYLETRYQEDTRGRESEGKEQEEKKLLEH
jgi:hypothetical protein